jgi:hypothetical protein
MSIGRLNGGVGPSLVRYGTREIKGEGSTIPVSRVNEVSHGSEKRSSPLRASGKSGWTPAMRSPSARSTRLAGRATRDIGKGVSVSNSVQHCDELTEAEIAHAEFFIEKADCDMALDSEAMVPRLRDESRTRNGLAGAGEAGRDAEAGRWAPGRAAAPLSDLAENWQTRSWRPRLVG